MSKLPDEKDTLLGFPSQYRQFYTTNMSSSGYQQASTGHSDDPARLASLIGSNIQKVQGNVTQMQRQTQQMSNSTDASKATKIREEVNVLGHDSKEILMNTNRMMKTLSMQSTVGVEAMELRQAKTIQDRLRNDLITVMNNLQTATRLAAKEEKESLQRAQQQAEPANIFNEPPAVTESEDNFGSTPFTPQQQQNIERNVDLGQIRERQVAVQQLETDIVDMNQMFKDLAVMVHEQGDMVDSIEGNVERAQVQVEAGGGQIRQALDYQRAARRKKVFLVAFLIAVVVIVIFVVYETWPTT